MVRSATLLAVNPEVTDLVLNILKSENKELFYDKEKNLALYVKSYWTTNEYAMGQLLIDAEETIKIKIRKDGEISIEPRNIKSCEEIKYVHFPQIKGSDVIHHAIVVLDKVKMAKLLSMAVREIIGRVAFLRISFVFTPTNAINIRNQFDDIVKIRGEDILDAFISDISLKGTKLPDTHEYQKILSGEIKYIGVSIGNEWFIVNSSGRIITYQKMSDEKFINYIKQIIQKLLTAGAVKI